MDEQTGIPDRYSVAVYFFKSLTDYVAQCGLPPAELLALGGVDPATLEDPDGRVPFKAFDRLCKLAARELNDPNLGLKLGSFVRAGHLGSHGIALMTCANGAELIRQQQRYSALSMDIAHAEYEITDTECVRYWRSNLPDKSVLDGLQEDLNQAIVVTLSRWFTNREDLAPSWVAFRHARPDDVSAYEALFRCALHFGAEDTAMAIDASFLDMPLLHSNRQLHRIMEDLCGTLMQQLGSAVDPAWLAMARRATLDSFQYGEPAIDAIADAAGLTVADLKDRLRHRGLSFRRFIDELRQALALGYVRDPDLSLIDIAYLLGFSEQSAFHRAFKRWTGMTPRDFRRGQ